MDAEFWYCDEELLVSQSILRDRPIYPFTAACSLGGSAQLETRLDQNVQIPLKLAPFVDRPPLKTANQTWYPFCQVVL